MAFQKKTWVDRKTEYPTRRRLTPAGETGVYDVERAEGLEIETGDALNAETLNDLEDRIETGIDEAYPTTISLTLPASWTDAGDGSFTQTVAVSGIADGMQINVAPDVSVLTQMAADGTSALFIQNNNGTATAICMGAALTASVTVQATLEVVK